MRTNGCMCEQWQRYVPDPGEPEYIRSASRRHCHVRPRKGTIRNAKRDGPVNSAAWARLVVLLALVASTSGEANAQSRVIRFDRAEADATLRLAAPAKTFQGDSTSFGQRFALSLIGALALGGSTVAISEALDGTTVHPAPLWAGYVAGGVLGASLAGRAKEGANPLGAAVGAALGALPLLADVAEGSQGELGIEIIVYPISAATIPLGAAIGHRRIGTQ